MLLERRWVAGLGMWAAALAAAAGGPALTAALLAR
ncbi:hypothetical protein EDF36_0530 [Rathayibacter sp. PhB152]|nr:hypothetical protein EDF36_0530 [Rathayibacter sp. PhB152]